MRQMDALLNWANSTNKSWATEPRSSKRILASRTDHPTYRSLLYHSDQTICLTPNDKPREGEGVEEE